MDWEAYKDIPADRLALQLAGRGVPDAAYIVRQVDGWQRLRGKVPSWAACAGLHYPPRLAVEQCSGEEAARCKRRIVQRLMEEGRTGNGLMADLTGGLGVDFAALAPLFIHAVYVERQAELCRIAAHNFPLLGLRGAEVRCGDGTDFLNVMPQADLLFLDPARRDGAGRKVVRMEDCQPDVCALRERLLARGKVVMVKLSPMLDVGAAVRALGGSVSEVHAVGAGGECKELLLVMERTAAGDPLLVAHEDGTELRFTAAEERTACPGYAEEPEAFLYEPGAAVMKIGAFRTVAVRYGLRKFSPDAHLYTGGERVAAFPGRAFRTVGAFTFSKADVRRLQSLCGGRANVAVRGFPGTAEALRRKLKLHDGGPHYLFATSLSGRRHLLVLCQKA